MLDHYEQHLRTSTSRNGRPYAEITIVGYMRCATRLANWLDDNEIAGDLSAACDPKIMNRFLLEYQSTHDINGTSFVQRNLRNLCAWLETECNVTSPYRSRELHTYTAKIHKPKVLGNEFITALLETCSKGSFTDVRDAAIIRLLLDGMRVGEVLAIAPEDVPPLTDPVLRVVPAKGELAYAKGSGRRILLEEETAKALQRWVRKREAHPLSRTVLRNELWLGQGSATPFRYNGVRLMLERRSKKALEGAPGHATSHMFRHTFAHDFRADGGSLDDLTQHMGWASYAMAQRYGKDMAEDRAIAAKREMRRKRGRKY
jgi:integrase